MPKHTFDLVCTVCGRRHPPTVWRCPCGGPLDLEGFVPDLSPTPQRGLLRWEGALALPSTPLVSLGEGGTPIVEVPDLQSHFKLEYISPTGSFKDRGAAVTITWAKVQKARGVVEDSSGNAGASISAYARRAGIPSVILMPPLSDPMKRATVEALGSTVVVRDLPRREITEEASKVADKEGYVFASHVFSPWFHEGTKTVAYEIAEELPQVEVVACPVAQGSLLLGIYKGFLDLVREGRIDRLPRLVAVQASGFDPLVEATGGLRSEGPPNLLADGIQIPDPPRRRAMVEAVRRSGGVAVSVREKETLEALGDLHQRGLLVEPTSAAALAGVRKLRDSSLLPEKEVVVILTGRWKGRGERGSSKSKKPS